MAVDCPYPGCTFATQPDTAPIVTAAILNGHMLIHSQAARPKPTPVRRPEIAAGGTTEGWQYFLTLWRAYSQAVRLAGTTQGRDSQHRRRCTHREFFGRGPTHCHQGPRCPGGEPKGSQGSSLPDGPGPGGTNSRFRSTPPWPSGGVSLCAEVLGL